MSAINNPKVSIIIIIYKVEKYLDECLKSIVSQTYDNIEIICVVGKGDEACETICRRYAEEDSRIKLIIDEPKGTAVARNQGLDAVTGEYIAFVDGDDKVDSDMIETMITAAVQNDADVSVVGKYYMYENTVDGNSENNFEVYEIKEAFETILYNDKFFLHMWDKLYKKELFDGIRFDVGKRVEDRQMAVKILRKAKKLVYNSASKYYFRVSHDSGSRVADNLKLSLDADYEICDELLSVYPDIKNSVDFFLMVENMSVIQSAFLYNIFSKKNNREQLEYIRSNLMNVAKLPQTSKGMVVKMILCGYFTGLFKAVTLYRRKKFLESHIEYGSGNDWAETFKAQKIQK